MSPAPRLLPWRIIAVHLMAADGIETFAAGSPVTQQVERAVNAFDALLAVAKAVGDTNDISENTHGRELVDAVAALDAQHPGWREWA